MFERVVATLLNRYLGKYIQDLDIENLNVGIFGGNVQLFDLKIKPDALYELDLPIEVKVGTIGKVALQIPWSSFTTQSVVAEIEEVYLIAAPITDRIYDPDKEKRLMRASKRRKLEKLEADNFLGTDAPESATFLENFVTTIMNNLQIFVRNVHIRYEDSVTKPGTSIACGFCIQNLSIETTNSKWKPIQSTAGLSSIYQMVRVESLSAYCNPSCEKLAGKAPGVQSGEAPYTWRQDMARALQTFSINNEEFDFLLKPITAKMKLIVSKSTEARVPKLLVDFVLQDAATQLSRQQYLVLIELADSFKRIETSRKFRQWHPGCCVSGNAAGWWKYAYSSVLAQRVRPYTWSHLKAHRDNYRRYRDRYKQTLLCPTDIELKLDLQQCEDLLAITDIIIAREDAKIQVLRENPERVKVVEKAKGWWRQKDPSLELFVTGPRGRGIWAQLSQDERSRLFDAIGYDPATSIQEKPKQYIEHKINFTLANCSVSLLNRGKEVVVVTLSQFLSSLETRPSAGAFKISARVESIVVEAASIENDLVPLITADNIYTGNTQSNFLSIDFEKQPLNTEADYGLSISLQPIEIAYHEHAVSELMSFVQTNSVSLKTLTLGGINYLINLGEKVAGDAILRHSNIQLTLDLSLPYLVIPELGTMQKGGNLAIIDFGQIKLKSELQPSNFNLDDLTQMEIEERLYDRFHIDLADFQILFCDAGDVWRDAKNQNDSEFHLVPKIQSQAVFSNSIKPEYRLLPRYKLNIGVTSIKINVSDRRIGLFLDFLDAVPIPSDKTLHISASSQVGWEDEPEYLLKDRVHGDPLWHYLIQMRRALVRAELTKAALRDAPDFNREEAKKAMNQLDKSFISSEQSDDDSELWARTVDLPGFDDNVSPNNNIKMLLRFIIGEIVIELSRSCNRVDKPYLMLQASKVCWDTALMEYGPAVQASLGSLHLVDKLHTALSGQYLELVSTNPNGDLISLLYRKVRADCPDFKSHFHSVEQSLVLDFTSASVILHREAFVTLNKYLQYLINKIQNRELPLIHRIIHGNWVEKAKKLISENNDPPIPAGAIKFSYSTRVSNFKVTLCDSDIEYMDIKLSGLESDCLFKANERMVLRMFLANFSIDDLSEVTLYPKLLSVEDEKVIECKYMRHSPRFYKQAEIDNNRDDVKSDGNFKLYIGRLHIVLLMKMLLDIQHFFEPFIKPGSIKMLINGGTSWVRNCFTDLRNSTTRLHLALDIHAPTVLLPQKATSPNLIILNLGDLNVENFFKEKSAIIDGSQAPVLDNILVRLENSQMSRAVMTLAGTLEAQEPIIEPMCVKLDIKRMVSYHNMMRSLTGVYLQSTAQPLLYQVVGLAEPIKVNIGQRDLSTIVSVWYDNFTNISYIGRIFSTRSAEQAEEDFTGPSEDHSVKKLQAFFTQNELIRREASLRFTMEGLQIYMFNDCEEILSSPLRDMSHGICKFEAGEANLSLDVFSDFSMKTKVSLQNCILEDIRKNSKSSIKKILQSHCGALHVEDNSNISVSTPPILDMTFKQTAAGDKCIDILMERTRLNLSVSFLLDFTRFILDALPLDSSCDGGLVNHGYIGDTAQTKLQFDKSRNPSSSDSTSGYFSSRASCAEDQTGLSISIHLRKPEIMMYSLSGSHAVLLRTEVLMDYSRQPTRESLVFSLSNLHILTKQHKFNRDKPIMVLYPCDIELARNMKSIDDGMRITVNISLIDVHIMASTVLTMQTLFDEINSSLLSEEGEATNVVSYSELEDLWSPRKMNPFTSPHVPTDGATGGCIVHEGRLNEVWSVAVPKVRIMLELEGATKRSPVLLIKSSAHATINNWSSSLQLRGELQIQASFYNCQVGAWEPLLEPISEEEGVYRPFKIQIKVFQGKAYPVCTRSCVAGESRDDNAKKVSGNGREREIGPTQAGDSETSADEADPTPEPMLFLRKKPAKHDNLRCKPLHESASMISYPEESDSDNEEGVMEKLACAISHLFTGDSSDGDMSDSESSGAEPSADTEDGSDVESMGAPLSSRDSRAVFIKKQSDSIDSGLEAETGESTANYVLIESRDRLELSVTPQALHALQHLKDSFTSETPSIVQPSITVTNDITPGSTATLVSKAQAGGAKVLTISTYDHSDSLPSSPASSEAGTDFFSPVESEADIDCFDGGFYLSKIKQDPVAELYSPFLKFPSEPVTSLYKKVTDHRIRFMIPGFEEFEILCPQRSCDKLHLLQPIKNNTRYYIILSVICHEWGQTITVRSPLQIRNETSYALGIYYKRSALEALGYELIGESTNPFKNTNRIAVIEPDETFNVPLLVAHHCKLYILPAYLDTYSISESGLWWQDLASDLNTPKDIFCSQKEGNDNVFAIKALCEEGVPKGRLSRLIPKYLLRLLPPLTIHNKLPCAVQITLPNSSQEIRIEAGEKSTIYTLNLMKTHKITVSVPCYLGIQWCGSVSLSPDVEEKVVSMMTEQDTEGGNKQLGLSVRVERTESTDFILYSPFWIINKTGLPLQLRASLTEVLYEAVSEEPLLFCFRKQRRQCVRLRVYHSSWSSAFSLDTFSTSGLVVCKDRERKRKYRILISSALSQVAPQLTRIITLSPNFVVFNDSKRPLRFMEENEKADLWIDIAPGQCMPFWPETEKMYMYVKFRDSKVVSQHFPITSVHQTVLRMDKGCGVTVDVRGSGDSPWCIRFRCYRPGDAPVRVDNLCEDLFLKISQHHLSQVALLSPYQSLLYTWDDPCKERALLWNIYNKKCKGYMADIWKDGYGQERVSFHTVRKQGVPPTVTAKLSASFKRLSNPLQEQPSSSEDSESDDQKPHLSKKTRTDKVVVYWVSYLEGKQRVLLFTQDERIAYHARGKIDSEKTVLEVFLSLKGFGISLGWEEGVRLRELCYVSGLDSAPLWEVQVSHRWKPLTLELSAWVEDKYRQEFSKAQMKEYVHVDFEKMHMTKPFFGELRRSYRPAVWVHFRKSNHYTFLLCKVHRLQIENQLTEAIFPIILHPSSIPSGLIRKVGIKPCIEFTVLKRNQPNQEVYKYIRVLVQEFCLQLDKTIVMAVSNMLGPWIPVIEPVIRIRSDITTLHQPLTNWFSPAEERKVVIENLYISPISIKLSFSSCGSSLQALHLSKTKCFAHDLVHYLIDLIASTHAEIKSVSLRTACLEEKGRVMTYCALAEELRSHILLQLTQQFHVLIRGLDVLSNPYGSHPDILDPTHNYDPILHVQRSGEGLEEYSEGLSLGVLMIMGHVCGGAATTGSLITAPLSHSSPFEQDVKKRRTVLPAPLTDLPESLVVINKTFEVGVVLGMSGIIVKHMTGMQQQEGVETFFKGIGKGLMGLMTKPSGGIIDSVPMAFDACKRSSEMGEEFVLRTRLPRSMNQYLGLKPYSVHEAVGLQLLSLVRKGHYADRDVYWAHAPMHLKAFLLITLQHVFLIEKCRLWGNYEVEWVTRIDDIMAVPTISDNKLVFKIRQDESLNYYSGDERSVQCSNSAVLNWLQKKIETAMIINMEDKPCPLADA